MSYNEEKMMILKMLQEGKITSEEAARLLEALDGGARQSADNNAGFGRQQRSQPNYTDEVAKFRERLNEWKNEFTKNINQNVNQKDFDRMVDDFSKKAEKVGKQVATATSGLVDKIMDYVGSFVDTGAFNIFGNYAVVEKTFQAAAREGMDLELEGINGQIYIKKHQESHILIKTKVRSPQENADSLLIWSDDGSTVSLKVNKTMNMSVAHEVYLPAVRFNKIKLETTNGKIYVEDSLSQEFESATKNAPIDLMGVNTGKLNVDTKNAKVTLSYIIAKDVNVDTKNSMIEVKNIKTAKMDAETANARIYIENVQAPENVADIVLKLKTSNGDIKVNMNDMDSKGYRIKAQTSNGGINLLVPELTYHNASKQGLGGSFVEAESSGYNNSPRRVQIDAETSNGMIEVVK